MCPEAYLVHLVSEWLGLHDILDYGRDDIERREASTTRLEGTFTLRCVYLRRGLCDPPDTANGSRLTIVIRPGDDTLRA